MTTVSHSPATLSTPARWLAAWLAGLVLALSVLAYAPTAHAALHAHADADEHEHQCAITWFNQGVDVPLALPDAPAPAAEWSAPVVTALVVVDLTAPRYLHLPGRAPPGWAG